MNLFLADVELQVLPHKQRNWRQTSLLASSCFLPRRLPHPLIVLRPLTWWNYWFGHGLSGRSGSNTPAWLSLQILLECSIVSYNLPQIVSGNSPTHSFWWSCCAELVPQAKYSAVHHKNLATVTRKKYSWTMGSQGAWMTWRQVTPSYLDPHPPSLKVTWNVPKHK